MEQPIKNIVVGFDFSKQATQALQAALSIASKTEAVVHVMTALPGHIEPQVLKAAKTGAVPQRDQIFPREALMQNLEGRVKTVVDGLEHGQVRVECEVSADKPFAALKDLCTLHHADLLVVGNSGMDALQRFFVGSTSQKLVRKSRWPVMVVKEEQAWPPKNIVCPVDLSDASRRALGWAAELAGLVGAKLHILTVREILPTYYTELYGFGYEGLSPEAESQARKVAKEQLEEFCDIADLTSIEWDTHVMSGRVDECISQLVKKTGSELLCMGSVGRNGVENILIGNTAERMLRHLPCSMLTVKPDDFVLK